MLLLKLFCCDQYEDLTKLYIEFNENNSGMQEEVVDIKPHAPYGSKAARKAAKEKAAEKYVKA